MDKTSLGCEGKDDEAKAIRLAAVTAGFVKMNLTSARRHVFLCTGPNCCARADGLATWEVLKAACKSSGAEALRSKADCLRICAGGPWMVVYPEGTWYGEVTSERCARIVEEHVKLGRPVAEWLVRTHPLLGGGEAESTSGPR